MRWGRRQTRIPSGPLPNSLERQTTRAFARPNGEHGVGNSVAVYLVVILYIQRVVYPSQGTVIAHVPAILSPARSLTGAPRE